MKLICDVDMVIKYLEKPKGQFSDLIAAWPGMGMLAVITVDHLRKELNAELIAEVYSPLNSISFKDGVLDKSRINNKIYASKNGKLLICIGDSQPLTASEVYDLAESIIDLGKEFGINRVFTTAATLSQFEGRPKVFGIVTKKGLLQLLKKHNVLPANGKGKITGLNGVILDVAKKAEMDGICLLGQINFMDIPQPRSAIAVLKVLSDLINLQINASELEKEADKIDLSIKRMIKPKIRRGDEKGLDYIG